MDALLSRRSFIRTSALGVASLAGSGVAAKPAEGTVWLPRKPINPSIDNLRVVCCHDPNMVNASCDDLRNFGDMLVQNAAAESEAIHRNMDAMAVALARRDDVAQAWAAILRKPEAKQWADVRAAIKVNCISRNHPRLAIVDKVCRELIRLGVPNGNIVVYDGCSDALPLYGLFVGNGLPAGVLVSDKNSLLGGKSKAATPEPDAGEYTCSADIAEGRVDILINCAVNKGCAGKGGATLTMKNHFGTFTPWPHGHGDFDYMLAISKSEALVGGEPPCQQLCIVDALWSMTRGPMGTPDVDTHRLVMGTFSPAVDYATIRRIREPVMHVEHAQRSVARFATAFGYQVADYDGMDFVSVKSGS